MNARKVARNDARNLAGKVARYSGSVYPRKVARNQAKILEGK